MKKIAFIAWFTFGIINGVVCQNFYDINTINTFEITFEESNWDYLLDQLVAAGQEERLIGTLSLNGQFFDSVGIRYKGNHLVCLQGFIFIQSRLENRVR